MASFSSCGVFGGLKVKALASPWSVGPSDDEEDGEIVVVGVLMKTEVAIWAGWHKRSHIVTLSTAVQ